LLKLFSKKCSRYFYLSGESRLKFLCKFISIYTQDFHQDIMPIVYEWWKKSSNIKNSISQIQKWYSTHNHPQLTLELVPWQSNMMNTHFFQNLNFNQNYLLMIFRLW
jgi:hypothetical protein